jgi:hypothetical protein
MLPEGTESLLLCELELLNLNPFGHRCLFFLDWRRIAEPGASLGKIVFEFLSLFAKHVKNCIPPRRCQRCRTGLIDLPAVAS